MAKEEQEEKKQGGGGAPSNNREGSDRRPPLEDCEENGAMVGQAPPSAVPEKNKETRGPNLEQKVPSAAAPGAIQQAGALLPVFEKGPDFNDQVLDAVPREKRGSGDAPKPGASSEGVAPGALKQTIKALPTFKDQVQDRQRLGADSHPAATQALPGAKTDDGLPAFKDQCKSQQEDPPSPTAQSVDAAGSADLSTHKAQGREHQEPTSRNSAGAAAVRLPTFKDQAREFQRLDLVEANGQNNLRAIQPQQQLSNRNDVELRQESRQHSPQDGTGSTEPEVSSPTLLVHARVVNDNDSLTERSVYMAEEMSTVNHGRALVLAVALLLVIGATVGGVCGAGNCIRKVPSPQSLEPPTATPLIAPAPGEECSDGWTPASWTYFISYAPCCEGRPNYDPSADTEECVVYGACDYMGDFAYIGHQTYDFVQSNNLIGFFSTHGDNSSFGNKMIRITALGITIEALVADTCDDDDCNGCCTENANPSGYLVNMEYNTVVTNFGFIGAADGQVCWQLLVDDGTTTSSGFCNWGPDGTAGSSVCQGGAQGDDYCNANQNQCESDCSGKWCT